MHFTVELHDELDRRLENQQQESIENDLGIPETVRKQLVNARIGQGEFRLRTYAIEPRCRLTGVSNSNFLTASHIKPWKSCSNQERLDGNNGLMLAPHVDRLFDRGWISFEDNGDVLVAKEAIPALNAWGLSETANVGEFTEKQCVYLAYHRGFLLKD
jgi:predicted restriction endonuclease